MTECMPISTPPIRSYDLDPSGTSGIAVGPRICIVTDDLDSAIESGTDLSVLKPGQVGNILVKGSPCFSGYEYPKEKEDENLMSLNDTSFFVVDNEPGWFSTGDCGYLNNEGYLFITGRSKEIINRGGETISPYEIEEAVIQHPQVDSVASSCII
jgi:acyl-CoA synthetase (AMP-forming)/AMP-acid ligase II